MGREGSRDSSGPMRPVRNRRDAQPRKRGCRIEERDIRLLNDIYTFSLLARDQILRLRHFATVSRLNRRLLILFENGYVSRHVPPFAPHGSQYLYGLARNGIRLVADRLGLEAADVRRHCRPDRSPVSWEHTAAITDFYLELRDAAAGQVDVSIERWLPERDARTEFDIRIDGGAFRRCIVRPDAFVRLRWRGVLLPAFIEIDRGHVSQSKWQRKVDSFVTFQKSGLFKEDFGQDRFAVLVVTTSAKRLGSLLSAAQASAVPFLGSMFAEVEAGALGAIWFRAAGNRPMALAEGIVEATGTRPMIEAGRSSDS